MPSLQEHITTRTSSYPGEPSYPHIRRQIDPPSLEERWAAFYRVSMDSLLKLTVGPLPIFGVGVLSVVGIASYEGYTVLRPSKTETMMTTRTLLHRSYFVARYAFSQILPSLVWQTQPAKVICESIRLDAAKHIFFADSIPAYRQLRMAHLQALRGAIAGSVLLTQILSLTGVLQESQVGYSNRIRTGQEPPLPSSDRGVVVRLAGRESDVTLFSMAKAGRRCLWPVYEGVPSGLVETYGYCQNRLAMVPVYWQVPNASYSQPSSWNNLTIPKSWFFESSTKEPWLVLEADATPGDGSSLSLLTRKPEELDLDLFEVAQGFHQICKLATTKESLIGDEVNDPQILRVILVDGSVPLRSGGNRQSTARQEIQNLRLADVVIDAKRIVSLAVKCWLDDTYRRMRIGKRKGLRPINNDDKKDDANLLPVILETPHSTWFQSLQAELRTYGYRVVDRADVEPDARIPVLVYGRTSADTIYTIRAFRSAGILANSPVCALLSSHEGLQDLAALNMPDVGHVCSSEIYDVAFEFVRSEALKGRKLSEIQDELDSFAFRGFAP